MSEPRSQRIHSHVERYIGHIDRVFPGDPASGTDFVAHRSEAGRLFAARCFTPRDKALAATCERSIRLGDGLFATYRFRQAQLEHWQKLDDGIASLASALSPKPAS